MQFVDLRAQRNRLQPQIDDAIRRVLEHGAFISGPEVADLERQLQEFTGAVHCVTCGNGTDALVLALRAKDLRHGEGVIVPSFTFAATPEAVVLAGGVPIFADINPISFNVDASTISVARKAAAARGVRVAGVIAVDLFGHPAPYRDIAEQHADLWIVADGAQGFGGAVGSKRVGTLADITTTSFFPAKPLGCYGDGGAIFTDDDEIAATLRSLRVHGQGSDKYDNVRVGTNSRLDTIQAAILLVKLAVFPEELAERQRVADAYRTRFASLDVRTPTIAEGFRSAWAQYTVRSPNRDAVAAALKAAGIPTAVYYRQPLHRSTAYASFAAGDELPQTELAAAEALSLPMHPYLSDADVQKVVTAVASQLGQA